MEPLREPQGALLPSLAVLAAMVSTTLGAALAKTLFPVIGPEAVVALRVVFSALVLALFARPWRARPDRRMGLSVLVFGLMLGLMNLTIYQAFARIPIGIAIAVEVTGPLAVALFSSRRRANFVWIALTALGLVLLLPIASPEAGLDPVGLLFAAAAAACWAAYILSGQRVSALGSGYAVSLGMTVASFVTVPAALAAGPVALPVEVLALGLVVALLSSAIPYSLEIAALARLPRQTFGLLVSSSPAVAASVGYLVLGERLAPMQWAAVALVVCASAGNALTNSRPPRG